MKGSFKPLLKRIKMRDAREGMLFMHPTAGLCRVKYVGGLDGGFVDYETVKNPHRCAYITTHIWIAIGWTFGDAIHRRGEMISELASMIERAHRYGGAHRYKSWDIF